MNFNSNKVRPLDNSILRSISTVVSRLPAFQSVEFYEEFGRDINDVMLLSTLAAVTKSIEKMNDLVDKRTVALATAATSGNERHGYTGKRRGNSDAAFQRMMH